jgi:hypothetical protein
MRCSYGFIEVNVPEITTQSANEYSDHYTPYVYKWTASTGWVLRFTGQTYLWSRRYHEWQPTVGRPHKFQIPENEIAKDVYWEVLQRVVDFETGFYWDAYAYLPNHDPEYCNATGPWD